VTTLADKLSTRIRSTGAITFRDFMESALYDPGAGYYNTERPKIGPSGDYYTSSNVHAAFGACVARLFSELLERPEDGRLGGHGAIRSAPGNACTILEVGAGTGQLAYDILTALQLEHPGLYSRVKYVIAERSPAMEARQREKLGQYRDTVEWQKITTGGHPDVGPVDGIIFSNELIDALPVHVVRATADGLEELYVVYRDEQSYRPPSSEPAPEGETGSREASRGEFSFAWGTLSSEKIEPYVERNGVLLSPGQVVEVNLDAVDWLQAAARILHSGYLVTIDYGDIAPHLYGEDRRGGTLRAFHKHALAASVLERAGEQDITASVNFTALIEYGQDAGLDTISFERQSAFLVRMGLIDRIAAMSSQQDDGPTDLKSRLAIKNLFVPGGSSDNFRVLIQSKAAGGWGGQRRPPVQGF
jgi:SAM-dependent MidA family methyltransferase